MQPSGSSAAFFSRAVFEVQSGKPEERTPNFAAAM
jgi:hypothetical protein